MTESTSLLGGLHALMTTWRNKARASEAGFVFLTQCADELAATLIAHPRREGLQAQIDQVPTFTVLELWSQAVMGDLRVVKLLDREAALAAHGRHDAQEQKENQVSRVGGERVVPSAGTTAKIATSDVPTPATKATRARINLRLLALKMCASDDPTVAEYGDQLSALVDDLVPERDAPTLDSARRVEVWRQWAQFVYLCGGSSTYPDTPEGDTAMREAVAADNDRQIAAMVDLAGTALGALRDFIGRARYEFKSDADEARALLTRGRTTDAVYAVDPVVGAPHDGLRAPSLDSSTTSTPLAHGGTPQDDELEDARNDIAGMRDVLKQIMDALELRGAHEISAVVGHIQKLKAAHGGTAPHPERTDAMTQREEAERGYANLKQDHRQIAHYVVERCGDFIVDREREAFIAEFLRAAFEAGQLSASQSHNSDTPDTPDRDRA